MDEESAEVDGLLLWWPGGFLGGTSWSGERFPGLLRPTWPLGLTGGVSAGKEVILTAGTKPIKSS